MRKLNPIQLIILIIIGLCLLPLVLFLIICFIIYGYFAKKHLKDTLDKQHQQTVQQTDSTTSNQKGRTIDHE